MGKKWTPKYIWDNLEEFLLIPSFAFSVILIFVQVVARNVFSNSISWSEELARFLYVWQVWLGISLCAKKRTHLRITLLSDLIKGKAANVFHIFVDVVVLVFSVMMTASSVKLVAQIAATNQTSTAMGISMAIPYAGITVGAILLVIRMIGVIIQRVRALKAPVEQAEGGNASL